MQSTQLGYGSVAQYRACVCSFGYSIYQFTTFSICEKSDYLFHHIVNIHDSNIDRCNSH